MPRKVAPIRLTPVGSGIRAAPPRRRRGAGTSGSATTRARREGLLMGGGAAAVGSVLGSSLGKAAKRKRGGRSIVKQRADQRRARKTRSLAKAAKGRIRKIGKRLAKKR